MKPLISTIKLGVWALLCSLCIMACTDDWNSIESKEKARAIELFVSAPNNYAVSRSTTAVKEGFVENDRIHLSITFTDINNVESTRYSCLKYTNKGIWMEDGTTNFNWPWNTVKADFKAYFIPKSDNYNNNSNLPDNGSVPLSLSSLSALNADPLVAEYTEVPAGASVYLQFAHVFSKVTFTNLSTKNTMTAGEELRLLFAGCNDQWTLTRKGGELNVAASEKDGYIKNTTANGSEVTFLIPAVKEETKLKIGRRDMSPLHSFKLPLDLVAGKHYKVDVTTLHDNYVSDDVREEDWNDPQAEIVLTPSEIGGYLTGISKGEPFSVVRDGKAVFILITYEKDNKQIVAQIRDVNFDHGTFTPPAEVKQNVIFNGNNHYIKNVKLTHVVNNCKALFAANNGKMSNLVIENVETEASPTTAETHLGILAGENNGDLENIHLKGTIQLVLGSSAKYLGALTGWTQSNITNCSVTGTLTLSGEHNSTENLNVGGLIGFAAGASTITKSYVQVEAGSTIALSGTSTMTLFCGGFVGQNAKDTKINQCWANSKLEINRTGMVNAGGFIGLAGGALIGNTATGDIAYNGTTIDSGTSIGGFIGVSNASISNCTATGAVQGTFTGSNQVAGFAGLIDAQYFDIEVKTSSATGSNSSNIGGFIGTTSVKKSDETTFHKISIHDNFCITQPGATFILDDQDNLIKGNLTISDCHLNGIRTDKEESFTPQQGSSASWVNDPPIYGNDSKGSPIYYLKR